MKTILLIAVLLLTVMVATAGNYPQQRVWEYKFVDYNCNEKAANQLAGQGWELVASDTASYSNVVTTVCIFKRAK